MGDAELMRALEEFFADVDGRAFEDPRGPLEKLLSYKELKVEWQLRRETD